MNILLNKTQGVVCAMVFSYAALHGCSADTNINQFLVSDGQKNSLTTLIEKAQVAYDSAKYTDALEYAEKAEKIAPNDENVAILLGYINLALTGMDTYGLARTLISSSSSSSTAILALASGGSASTFLESLREGLKISNSDLEKLGTFEDDDSLEAFKDYPVIIPVDATTARAETAVNALQRLNSAITKICPFIADSAKVADRDTRHDSENCGSAEYPTQKSVAAHVLWAFSHILEAAVFYGVVQYQSEDLSDANLRLRATSIESLKDSVSIGSYAQHIVTLAENVDGVFDLDTTDSMFNALINDIVTAGKAFTTIGNVPANVTKGLDSALSSIEDVKTVSGTTANEKQGNSLKSQLNKAMSSQVSSQISSLAKSNPTEFAENKDELCDAYATISGAATLPDEC